MSAQRLLGGVACAVALAGIAAAAAIAANDDLSVVNRATGAAGAVSSRPAYDPAISATGRYVAFVTDAADLGAHDPDHVSDVYVRDIFQNTTTLVSQTSNPSRGDPPLIAPSLSGDGRVIAFMSSTRTVDAGFFDTTFGKIFARDTAAGTTMLVSRATGADGAEAGATSSEPVVSANGRFVAYSSDATNLTGDDADAVTDVFVRDLQTDTTVLVSGATGTDGPSRSPSISADGRYVAFRSEGNHPNATPGPHVLVRDLETRTTKLVGTGWDPVISADGRTVAFASLDHPLLQSGDVPTSGILVQDLQTGARTVASRGTGADGAIAGGGASDPDLSADGRFVAFVSSAANLAPGAAGNVFNVFVRDLQTNTTRYVSRGSGPQGVGGDFHSGQVAISADGSFVAFQSAAKNLTDEDNPNSSDPSNVFVRQLVDGDFSLPPPPSPPAPAPQPAPPAPPTPVDELTAAPARDVAPVAAVGDPTAPRLTGLALAPRSLRVSRGRARTVVSLRLSERATVEVTVERLLSGRRSNGRCVASSRARRNAPLCTRTLRARRAFTRTGRAGLNRFRFDGRLSGRALAPGRYRLRVIARDAAGNASRPSHATFRVTR